MGSSQQAFLSTPTFELFRRGLQIQTVKQFRGLNAYTLLTQLGPDWAQDLLNVIVSGSGGLSKLRLPVKLSANVGVTTGPGSFWDFQQANGARQVIAQFGNSLYYLTNDLAVATLIETNALDSGQWSFAQSNNLLFGANGQRMQKWTGSAWQQWGIAAPSAAPTASFAAGVTVARATNVVTVTLTGIQQGRFPAVGDVVQIVCNSDASYNGSFAVATVNIAAGTFTYNQTGANSGAFAAVLTVSSITNARTVQTSGAVRSGGVVTLTFASAHFFDSNASNYAFTTYQTYLTISGATDASFNGTFLVTFPSATTIQYNQPGLADSTTSNAVAQYPLTPATGYSWAISLGNSLTGHQGNISPVSVRAVASTAGRAYNIIGTAIVDAQVDTAFLYRTLDGGGDYFFVESQGSQAVGNVPTFLDSFPDANLDQTKRGPLINNPPLQGLYTAVGQSRVFVFNLVGSPQDIIYSGYEQILVGRPEESFPPNNRLRLSIGAEIIAGGGVLQSGIVAFSQTGRMYMLRGQVEDISLAVPINFTSYLEELPWTLGCKSHFSVQSTPYGLVWLAGDKTVQLFDGRGEPVDISAGVYPLLRRITPGQEGNCVAGYFNWLERDWYALLAPVDGSLGINRIFFFAFNKAAGTNTVDSVECFVSDIPARIAGTTWIGLITTSKLQRLLCIGAGGFIQNLPVVSDTVGGITLDYTINPATSGNLPAYWRGGYWGNDQPQRSKNFRWARLITDQLANSFQMQFRMVDDEQRTLVAPEILGPRLVPVGRVPINRRAKRMAPEIDFPATDAPANVLEMQVASIATSER